MENIIGGNNLLAQVYLNWTGTADEFEKVKTIVKDVVARSEGIDLQGLYVPTNKWNYVVIYNINNFENFLGFQKEVRTQLKSQGLAKISVRKLVLMIKEKELS